MSRSPARPIDTSRVDHDLALMCNLSLEGILGIDEVGRGPGAGPLTLCGVWLTPESLEAHWDVLVKANDSKSLTEKRREDFYESFMDTKIPWTIVNAPAQTIDQCGIERCLSKAVESIAEFIALQNPLKSHGLVLMDGDHVSLPGFFAKYLVKGDTLSCAIACASVVAKVTRDRYMKAQAQVYPGYGFEKHSGYLTPQHLKAIEELGPCGIHRMSFEPLKSRRT